MAGPRRVEPLPTGGFFLQVTRASQLLCCLVVASEMFYFIHHLRLNSWSVPWMFFFLQGAALATLLLLVVLAFLHWRRRTVPLFPLVADSILSILWIVGFAFLANAMRWTLLRRCTAELWGPKRGVSLCVLYKLLFSASLVATVSSIAAVAIGVSNQVRSRSRGKYAEISNPLLHKMETEYAPHGSSPSARDVTVLYDGPEPPTSSLHLPTSEQSSRRLVS